MEEIPFEEKYALTDKQMLSFCQKHGIPAKLVTLEEYNISGEDSKYLVIFTGSEPNQYNTTKAHKEKEGKKTYEYESQPITHHWLGGVGNVVFDSYGYYEDYEWPEGTEFVHTIPKRLQEFDSNVCGLYVLGFLWYCYKQNPEFENIGRDYTIEFGLTSDRSQNDINMAKWYDSAK